MVMILRLVQAAAAVAAAVAVAVAEIVAEVVVAAAVVRHLGWKGQEQASLLRVLHIALAVVVCRSSLVAGQLVFVASAGS